MFSHERALKCLKLFIKWIGSQIPHEQNLADYSPQNAEGLHTAVNRWLEAEINEVSARSGTAFRRLCFSTIVIPKDKDTPMIMIETRGGGGSLYMQPLESGSNISYKSILKSYLEKIAVNKLDIHEYETGTLCDDRVGINITDQTAQKIFDAAGVSNQVREATKKAMADRGWQKAKPTTLVSL